MSTKPVYIEMRCFCGGEHADRESIEYDCRDYATKEVSLVAALIAEGGEIAESVGVTFADMPEGFDGLILAVESRAWTATPGRYLVYGPIPKETTT